MLQTQPSNFCAQVNLCQPFEKPLPTTDGLEFALFETYGMEPEIAPVKKEEIITFLNNGITQ
jgi:hypothetical protein